MPANPTYDIVARHTPDAIHCNIDGEVCYVKDYDKLNAVVNYWTAGRIAVGQHKKIKLTLVYNKRPPIEINFSIGANDRALDMLDCVKAMAWHYPNQD